MLARTALIAVLVLPNALYAEPLAVRTGNWAGTMINHVHGGVVSHVVQRCLTAELLESGYPAPPAMEGMHCKILSETRNAKEANQQFSCFKKDGEVSIKGSIHVHVVSETLMDVHEEIYLNQRDRGGPATSDQTITWLDHQCFNDATAQ